MDFDINLPRPIRKRRRPPKACEQCRKRKVRCDQMSPCNQCIRMKIDNCTYDPQTLIKRSKLSNDSPRTVHHIAGAPPTPVSTGDRDTTYTDHPSRSGISTHVSSPDAVWHIAGLPGGLNRPQPHWSSNELLENSLLHCGIGRGNLNAAITKTRLLGRSHWINVAQEFPLLGYIKDHVEAGRDLDIIELLDKCKILSRKMKSKIRSELRTFTNLRDHIPSRDVADGLFENYFRVFESCYRILHVPSFRREYNQYWITPESSSPIFVVKLLLVLAIGTCLSSETSIHHLHVLALEWINAAQSWLSSPFTEKSKLSVSGIQIHCLLLLAREIHSVSADLIWTSAGSLLRTAILGGLHRDPSKFPHLSAFQAEIRRRLWATVMEICLQSSMNIGGSPMFSTETHDCRPPSNLDDTDMDEAKGTIAPPKPENVYTQSTMQLALLQTLPIRCKIANMLNDFKINESFTDTLQIGAKLTEALQASSSQLKSAQRDASFVSFTTCYKVYELMTYRFLLSLHQTFAIKAMTDPSYYFSRKVCVDTALLVASTMFPITVTARTQDFDSICEVTSGTLKSVFGLAFLVVFLEISTQLHSGVPATSTVQDQLLQQEIFRVAEAYTTANLARLKKLETNVKGYVFSTAGLAYLRAKLHETDLSPGDATLKSIREALHIAADTLEKRLEEISSAQPEISGPISNQVEDVFFNIPFDDFRWNEWEPNFDLGMKDLLPSQSEVFLGI